jgi:hypothetical protein
LGDPEKIKTELANWFDNGMDRLSGVYKRRTQCVNFFIALFMSLLLNVDAITIAKSLWDQPTLVANLKVADKIPSTDEARKYLEANLPVGWPDGLLQRYKKDANGKPLGSVFSGNEIFGWDGLVAILGWLITSIAALFGAPFWFDALQMVTRLKGSGPSPDEKKERRAAAA